MEGIEDSQSKSSSPPESQGVWKSFKEKLWTSIPGNNSQKNLDSSPTISKKLAPGSNFAMPEWVKCALGQVLANYIGEVWCIKTAAKMHSEIVQILNRLPGIPDGWYDFNFLYSGDMMIGFQVDNVCITFEAGGIAAMEIK
jgi:hypothetical protein